MEQFSILTLFLVLASIATIVFTYVYLTSKTENQTEQGMKNPLKKRFWFFLILFVILAIFASVTIPKSPYYLFAEETPNKVIHVSTMQFAFFMSKEAIDPTNPTTEDIALPANQLVEFRVSSIDVNHGFGIYDPSDRLISQVQAMPGYINRLRYKFIEPGTYHILCLEYCGMAHQVMRTSFIVK